MFKFRKTCRILLFDYYHEVVDIRISPKLSLDSSTENCLVSGITPDLFRDTVSGAIRLFLIDF
jgi:hypothetical protein